MDRKDLVNVKNPQWIERNLRKYTIDKVYEVVKNTEEIFAWEFQYHFYLMSYCNKLLEEEIRTKKLDSTLWKDVIIKYKISSENFWIIFDDKKDSAVQEIIKSISPNVIFNSASPLYYFELFRAFTDSKDEVAVRSIVGKKGLDIQKWYYDFDSKGISFCKRVLYSQMFHDDNTFEFYCNNETHVYNIWRYARNESVQPDGNLLFSIQDVDIELLQPLLNCSYIAERNVPVFLIDSFYLAQKLQRNYSDAYGLYIKKYKKNFFERALGQKNYSDTNEQVQIILQALEKINFSCETVTKHYSNIIWSSWFGGYDLVEKNDWSVLEERTVFLFQVLVDYKKSLENFVHVARHIQEIPKIKLFLVFLEDKIDVLCPEKNPFRLCSYLEALDEAHQKNIDLDDFQTRALAKYLRDQNRIPRRESKFIIDPIIRLNTFNVISGLQGSGKSWFAMILGAAISVRGELFYDWDVIRKGKVVYIADDEMSESLLDDRGEVLRKLYRHYSDNFKFECVKRVNLLNREDRFDIESRFEKHFLNMAASGGPSVLILDHLNKLTDNLGNQKQYWPEIRKWIEDLNTKKITVILIHHEYNEKKMSGTMLIAQDADTVIHVESGRRELGTHELELVYSVPKNRGAKDQQKERSIILNMERGAKFQMPDEPPQQAKEKWKDLANEVKYSRIKELQQKMTMAKIAEYFNCSKSTVEKFCKGKEGLHKRKTHSS